MSSKYIGNYQKIAIAIKEERKKLGFSQDELALKIGVSKSYISKIEAPNSPKSFSLELLFEISDALNVPIKNFFRYLEQ